MTAEPGDIVLYAGVQIPIFHGSSTWAYARLGHIANKTTSEMADLLSNGDTSMALAV